MRTNGFALFRGPDSRDRAEEAVARVSRQNRSILFSFGSGGVEDQLRGGDCLVAYSLEEKGGLFFPVVHGFAEERGDIDDREPHGEFAFVTEGNGRILAGRDSLGTRALYIDEGRTCVASDHRLFPQRPALLSRGVRIELGSGEQRTVKLERQPEVQGTEEEAAGRLCTLLEESVARRVKGRRRVAVSFSGGLDSSLLALLAARHAEVVLCSAYTESSTDHGHTEKTAESLGLEHRGALIDGADAAEVVRSLDLPFAPGPMDMALWCLFSTTSKLARENGAELILLGQLADELFGGYMKYTLEARKDEVSAIRMMEHDVAASANGAFIRDELACSRFIEVRFPFADDGVAGFGLALPLAYKIRGGERKAILRTAASMLGLPEEIVRAPKKAAQYSSGLSKLFR
ncbi:MAG: asparagine synthase-related protein [Thaumarchaeota archaeon]|nr:asparagine synthase-related protein [Nitrososphaerota archaeon]